MVNELMLVLGQAMQRPSVLVSLRVGVVVAAATVHVASCSRCVHTSHTFWWPGAVRSPSLRLRSHAGYCSVLRILVLTNDKRQSKPLATLVHLRGGRSRS